MTITPGPWRWEANAKGRQISLCGGRNPYDLIVVDFVRWGMGGAQPRFRTGREDLNVMKPATDFLVPVAGRVHHASWFQDVDHPDATLIAAAPDLLAACEAVLGISIMQIDPLIWAKVVNAIAKARGVPKQCSS